MKKLTGDTLFARALTAVARLVLSYPRSFLYLQLILFVVCIAYTKANLNFDMSRNNLVGADKKYHQIYSEFKKEFPTQEDLVVVVQSEDPERNRQFVERLGARLEAETNLFKNVFYKGDLKMMGNKALLFVDEGDLEILKQKLGSFRPFLEPFTRATNLNSLFSLVNTRFRTASPGRSAENEAFVKALPAMEGIIRQMTEALRRPGTPPSPGVTALFNPGPEAQQRSYITFANGQLFLVTTQAPDSSKNSDAVNRLRELVDETLAEVPGLNVGLTGEPVLDHDEMVQSQKDTTKATVASLIICALIFIYGYQETGRPVK